MDERAATGCDTHSLVQLWLGAVEQQGPILTILTLQRRNVHRACLSVRGVMTRRPELPRYSYPYRASALIMRTIKVSCSSVAFQTLSSAMQCCHAKAAVENKPRHTSTKLHSRFCYANNTYPQQLHDYELQHSKGARWHSVHTRSVLTRASEDAGWRTDLGRDS